MDVSDREELREALKLVAVALKESGVPFALTGGYAVWARGGPEPDHDVDFVIAEEDAPRVRDHLVATGLEVRDPPEDWLFKVNVGDAFVDLIYRMSSRTTTHEDLRDVDEMEVLSVSMPVLSATEVRRVDVRSGEIVADIAHVESAPNATYGTPTGRVEVLGTMFVLSATEELASVRVARGVVRATSDLPVWEVAEPGRRIALVAHAGTNSVTIGHLLGLAPTPWEWDRFVLGHTSISRLEALPLADGFTFSLTKLSDLEHLDPGDRTR